MVNFHGGTVISVASAAPLAGAAGYVLANAGNTWVGLAFLILTTISFILILTTLSRYVINFQTNHALPTARYTIQSYANRRGLSGERIGYYLDEYDRDGNWISGQWIVKVSDKDETAL